MRRWGAIGLAAAGIIWLRINKTVGEGRTLVWVAKDHGLTTADLYSLAAFGVAVRLLRENRGKRP